ncbi:hypothetical protein FD755_017877, partial [Muntiacus reevesi]
QKGAGADQIIEYLKQKIALIKEKAILQTTLQEEKKLQVENAKLKKTNKGGRGEEEKMKEKTEKKGEKKEKKQQPVADSKSVDVSPSGSLNWLYHHCQKTPFADSLYVDEVDVGALRTVVSGLVNHVPLNRCKIRWWFYLSQAVVMCESSPEKVEILAPPNGSVTGDRITFHRGTLWISFMVAIAYHDKELNPKKMISEQIQPDLYTNDECATTYKGAPFEVKGKGVCRAQTMANSGIK